ncbi:hypothetical protein JCM33374_g2198 [Metschnikowia sp. JCM 33374]|nr:hypothetical protein JCM33374_g2198 [Metschnikowia sp. JCM 33374]
MQSQVSRTQTQTSSSEQTVLHLRPASQNTGDARQIRAPRQNGPRVRWTSDVVDNEHLEKKKSKICCIFHPQREFGESSDEDSCCSSESSDSSDESDASDAETGHQHHEVGPSSAEGAASEIGHGDHCCSKRKPRKAKSKSSKTPMPNAYERQPQYKNRSTLPANAI